MAYNRFDIEPSYPYYNGSAFQRYEPVSMFSCTDSTLIGNDFSFRELNAHPWIYYVLNNGTNCISGNIFTNFAIHSYYTDITSCFRRKLVDCIYNTSTDCNQGFYGPMEPSLSHVIGQFIMTTYRRNNPMIAAFFSKIALDNVNITLQSNGFDDEYNPVHIDASWSDILFVDTYVEDDMSYLQDTCVVIRNDRLATDPKFISLLKLECYNYTENINNNTYTYTQTMSSSVTKSVNHSSAVQLNIVSATSTYYPGKILKFTFNIMDKFDNVFLVNLSEDLTIHVENGMFSTEFEIESGGNCPICETGILFNQISIKKDIGKILNFSISVDKNVLDLTNSEFWLEITGCPIMYGPMENNYTCIQCDTDKYNLDRNSVQKCATCDADKNKMIKCHDGNITIQQDYWMDFRAETIISSVCPSRQCCHANNCDYIYNKDSLCAKGRKYESRLCSECKDKYTESMNNAHCIYCPRTIYLEYLLYPLLIATFWTLLLSITTSDRIQVSAVYNVKHDHEIVSLQSSKRSFSEQIQDKFERILSEHYLILMIKTLWTRNLLYYEQGLSQILSQGSYTVLFGISTQIFNLSMTTNAGGDKGWCFVNGLRAKGKILLNLLTPLIVMILITIIYLVSKCLRC
eukprot:69927_1